MADYVIIQAGGRGSRLRHLTWNKPKCLVSVEGRPILYRIFERFPGAKFVVIGDYKFDELKNYLKMEPPGCDYTLVRTKQSGTAAGISDALEGIDEASSIVLIWSDILIEGPELDAELNRRIDTASFGVVLTDNFVCRWSKGENGVLAENPSATNGVSGVFYMKNKSALQALPDGGEFVKWLSRNVSDVEYFTFNAMHELGDFDTIEGLNENSSYCRFFNSISIENEVVKKTLIDDRYRNVAEDESNWYREVSARGFRHIPRIYSYEPLEMQRVRGRHLFQLKDLDSSKRLKLVQTYLEVLEELHALGDAPADTAACHSVYFRKTVSRIKEVESINPFSKRKSFVINGRKCVNYLHDDNLAELEKIVTGICSVKNFSVIHGDCTFSNSLLSEDGRIFLIDPRGAFDEHKVFGDPRYDFAKLYYSCYSNYDAFNRRKFKLYLDGDAGIAEILMDESSFKAASESVFQEYFGSDLRDVEIINSMIWASLSGYAKDDLDSAIGSYCLGVYYLNEALK